MKVWLALLIILICGKSLTAQAVKIDTGKLLEYYETQRYTDAAQYLQSIYPSDTKDIKALTQIAYCHMMAGKLPEAEKNYLKVNDLHPDSLPVLFSLAGINSRRGNVSNARTYLQKIIQLDSLNFSAYKQLAAYEDTSEGKLRYLKKAHSLSKTEPDVAYDLSMVYRELKQYQPAYEVLKTAIAADTENFSLQQALLPLSNQLGKYQESIEIGEKLLKNRADPNVMNDLGQAYFYVKDYEKCITMYKILETLEVQNEGILYYMTLSYRELKDYDNAAAYAQKTIDEAISKHIPLYYAALAGIYEDKNQYNEATTTYKRGLSFGSSPIISYRLGLLYDLHLKQPKNAIQYYQMYLKNKPDTEKEKEQIEYAKNRILVLAATK